MEITNQIRKAKNGDQKAFTFLLNRFWNDVYRFQHSLIKNNNEAEDITIETFAKAFEKISKFDEKYDFKNWLLTISRNVYIDHKRKNKKNDILFTETELPDRADEQNETDEEDYWIMEQKLAALQKALKQLKHPYRKILEYRYFHHMSYKEIAGKTGLSMSNVKIRLMRARQMLLKKLS